MIMLTREGLMLKKKGTKEQKTFVPASRENRGPTHAKEEGAKEKKTCGLKYPVL